MKAIIRKRVIIIMFLDTLNYKFFLKRFLLLEGLGVIHLRVYGCATVRSADIAYGGVEKRIDSTLRQ